MRKLYFSFLLLLFAFTQVHAQNVNVTATAGTPAGSYLTLKGAFDAINAGTHQGIITIDIAASTVETATAQLNAPTAPASYTGITISTSSLLSVSASIAGSLINFNGATNVTIDGNNQLTFTNGTPTGNVLTLSNSASDNVIRNCTLLGLTSSATSGVIALSTAGTGNGNDNNLFENVSVDGQFAALNLLFSAGTTTSSVTQNSANTVRNSLFRNVSTTIASPTFIFLSSGNTGWIIQGNSLYQTTPTAFSAQGIVRGIIAFPAWTSDAHNINGNFVGGNAPGAVGTMQLNGFGAIALGFIGLDIETGGSGNIVQNNLVRNVALNYSFAGGSFSNAGIFCFIGGYNGISTITRNNVNNLSFTNTAGSALAYGIHCNGRVSAAGAALPTFVITNDTLDAISGSAGGAGNVQIFGMRLETSSGASLTNTATSNPLFFVKGNTISNFSTTFAGTSTVLRGITNINTQGTTSTAQLLPLFFIDSNKINNFSCAGTPGSITNPAVVGVYFTGSSVVNLDVQNFSRNIINDLSATSTADVSNSVMGYFLNNGAYDVSQNKIYALRNSASGAVNNPSIIGVNVRATDDTANIYNNFISLGSGQTNNLQVLGIMNNFSTGEPINAYYNSIYIAGTGAGGNTKSSAAILRGAETFAPGTIATPIDIKNNILYNVRTGGTGGNYAVANTHTTPNTGWTSDYNNLFTTNPSTIALWGAAPNDLATYKTNSVDVNSKSFTVTFADADNGDLHLAGTSIGDQNLKGVPIGGFTTDFDDQVRNDDPYIGADEVLTAPLPVEVEFFTGRKQANVNLLAWKASCTSSSITFDIERSTDGRRFTSVGKITASQARCDQPFDYADATPAAGMNYYRLKMTEDNGALKYSVIIAIMNKTSGFEIVGLYPTLVQSKATLSVTAAKKSSLQISITDASGRMMLQRSAAVAEGSALIDIDLSTLARGVYHLTGTTPEGYTKTIRFIKQ